MNSCLYMDLFLGDYLDREIIARSVIVVFVCVLIVFKSMARVHDNGAIQIKRFR